MSNEVLPEESVRVELCVMPDGSFTALGGDREEGDGDQPLIGLERINSIFQKHSRTREVLVAELNDRAKDVVEGHQKARGDCVRFAMQRRWLTNLVDELQISEGESHWPLRSVYADEQDRPTDEDDRLIETALQFVSAKYDKGKYEGRDAVGFFRTLFGRISDDLLLKFDEAS